MCINLECYISFDRNRQVLSIALGFIILGPVLTIFWGKISQNGITMTYVRPFRCDDLLKFNNINLDPLTETYGMNFYFQYLAHWPELFQTAESPSGELMGYIMGKAEGRDDLWHGHVTAVTVAPEYRRIGLAGALMKNLEQVSEKKRCYFVDLFVRVSNKVAVDMYHKLGYIIYRRVLDYYSGDSSDEDAFDMRKALSRDVEKKSVVPLKSPVRPEDVEF